MKIAWVVPGGVDRSGRERVIPVLLWLIEELAARHELHVFALRQYPQACHYPLLGASIHNLGNLPGPPGTRSLRRYRALLAGLRAQGPFDVLHGFWAGGGGFLAALAGKRLGLPTIVTLAGGELVALPEIGYGAQIQWWNRLRVALSFRWASQVTAASGYMCRLAKAHGVRALEIPLGVPPGWITGDSSRLSGPPWKLLHVASLNRVKDQPTLLLAFLRVLSVEPAAHLDIIGEDTLNGEIQRLCERLGLTRHVSFHGFMPNDEIQPFYRQAHLSVLPSRHDAAPLVMLEAAACGLPTIGTFSTGYAADWHPEAAWAVPAADPQALAEAVLKLLRDPLQRAAMGRAAQQRARLHDSSWTSQEFEKLYARLKK
jgi:glycosyltransferase involved in cell wall biosynthesis